MTQRKDKKPPTRIGRPPLPAGKARTIRKSIRVSEDVAAYLMSVGTGVVQSLVEESIGYDIWKALQKTPKRPKR